MSENIIEVRVPEEYNLRRIDKFINNNLETDISRSYIQKLIKEGAITVNGDTVKPSYKIKTDDLIKIAVPEPEEADLKPENIDINIVYEDDYIAVINKQPGLVIHPGPGNRNHTLVNALLYHLHDLSSIGGVIRPGIVHRLDKDTSGLMVIAKNDNAHRELVRQFSQREVKKRYEAIVAGKPNRANEIIDRPIGRHRKYGHKMTVTENGKEALTEYRIKKIWNVRNGIFSHLDINLYTGRTHQIRVHLSAIGNPVIGDPIYSKKWEKYKVPYLLLASTFLELKHPISGEKIDFNAGLPQHILNFIYKLEGAH